MLLNRLFKKLIGAKEMNRGIELSIRSITYSDPCFGGEPGTTTIETCPFLLKREAISITWKLEGKRDDVRVGQKISCKLTLHDAEDHAEKGGNE